MAATQACIHAPYFFGTSLPCIHTHLPETFRENADHGTQDNLHSQKLHPGLYARELEGSSPRMRVNAALLP